MKVDTGRAGLTALVLLVAISARSAIAEDSFSMTGSYEGVYACDSTTAGVPSGWGRPMSLALVQSGDAIRIDLKYVDKHELGAEYSLYAGKVSMAPDGATINGYFEACGATFPAKEIVRIFPASVEQKPFQFSAQGVWASDQVPNMPGLTVQSCTWYLKRVSTDAPAVRDCTDVPD